MALTKNKKQNKTKESKTKEGYYKALDTGFQVRVVFLPSKLWMVFVLWLGLGLGTKPEDRPEVEEGERDTAALLLLGVLRELLELQLP